MRHKTKKFTQKTFAALFTCLDQPGTSRLLNGIDKVSSPLAFELADIFPGKSAKECKHATKEDINTLYNQLKREAEVA